MDARDYDDREQIIRDNSIRNAEDLLRAVENLNGELYKMRVGLKHIQSMCGNPDAVTGLRLIIKKCEELLNDD